MTHGSPGCGTPPNLIRRNADFVISAESGFGSVVLLVSDSLSIIGNADTDHDGHQQQARGAVRRHHVGDGRIPSIKPGLVSKYVDDLRVLGLLEPGDEADATFGAEAHREMVGARSGT